MKQQHIQIIISVFHYATTGEGLEHCKELVKELAKKYTIPLAKPLGAMPKLKDSFPKFIDHDKNGGYKETVRNLYYSL